MTGYNSDVYDLTQGSRLADNVTASPSSKLCTFLQTEPVDTCRCTIPGCTISPLSTVN